MVRDPWFAFPGTVHDLVVGKLEASFDDLDQQVVKNIVTSARLTKVSQDRKFRGARIDHDLARVLPSCRGIGLALA